MADGTESASLESLKAVTRRNLDSALQQFVQVHYSAGVLVDWSFIAETVDANLDEEVDQHALYMGMSDTMSSWKMIGYAAAFGKFVYAGV